MGNPFNKHKASDNTKGQPEAFKKIKKGIRERTAAQEKKNASNTKATSKDGKGKR